MENQPPTRRVSPAIGRNQPRTSRKSRRLRFRCARIRHQGFATRRQISKWIPEDIMARLIGQCFDETGVPVSGPAACAPVIWDAKQPGRWGSNVRPLCMHFSRRTTAWNAPYFFRAHTLSAMAFLNLTGLVRLNGYANSRNCFAQTHTTMILSVKERWECHLTAMAQIAGARERSRATTAW